MKFHADIYKDRTPHKEFRLTLRTAPSVRLNMRGIINKNMKVTLTLTPIPENRQILGELFDEMKKSGVEIEYGENLGSILVEARHKPTTEKILSIHGYRIVEKHMKDAIGMLAKKYQLNEMAFDLRGTEDSNRVIGTPRSVSKPEPTISKRALRSFIQNKLRNARGARSKRRVQHVRDNLEGQVQAFEEILRYLRKR